MFDTSVLLRRPCHCQWSPDPYLSSGIQLINIVIVIDISDKNDKSDKIKSVLLWRPRQWSPVTRVFSLAWPGCLTIWRPVMISQHKSARTAPAGQANTPGISSHYSQHRDIPCSEAQSQQETLETCDLRTPEWLYTTGWSYSCTPIIQQTPSVLTSVQHLRLISRMSSTYLRVQDRVIQTMTQK